MGPPPERHRLVLMDLLFTSHNRLRFTQESFRALLDNTDWQHVDRLLLVDDRSTDGTLAFLEGAVRLSPVPAKVMSGEFGGPVAAMNAALNETRADVLGKIDNDVIVCPGWLNEMLGVLERGPEVDALGMEPGFGQRYDGFGDQREYRPARWIGGVGLFRTRVFKRRPSQNDRFFGLTQHWRRHALCAWITPDLPMFLLDHLPFEPWRSLAASYVARNWSRQWPAYAPEFEPYWSWWSPEVPA